MVIEFTKEAHADFLWWQKKHPAKAERIRTLCRNIAKTPFEGLGKPEPLKYDLQGCWSRRIDKMSRLVYSIEGKTITVISCRYYY